MLHPAGERNILEYLENCLGAKHLVTMFQHCKLCYDIDILYVSALVGNDVNVLADTGACAFSLIEITVVD